MTFRKTSDFGEWEEFRTSPHKGVDYSIPEGTPIQAIMDGEVIRVVDFGDKDAGMMLEVQMENGDTAMYAHLSEFKVSLGDKVETGQTIAISGNTGETTGEHLHFAIKDSNGEFIDPSQYEPLIANMGDESFWQSFYNNSYILNSDKRQHFWSDLKDWIIKDGSVDNYNPEGAETIPGQMVSNFWDSAWESIFYHVGNELTETYETLYFYFPEIFACVTILAGMAIMVTGKLSKIGMYYGIGLFGGILWLTFG